MTRAIYRTQAGGSRLSWSVAFSQKKAEISAKKNLLSKGKFSISQ